MTVSLLPPNATPLERAMACVLAEISHTPVPLRDLWNYQTCPIRFLPYLAKTLSVDRWDDTWQETTKREVIRQSFWLHKRKGTITALRHAVEPLGYLIEISEWWQHIPPGQRGTFALCISVLDTGITDEMFNELVRVIDEIKPASRHLIGLNVRLETHAKQYFGSAAYHGETLTVYPNTQETINVSGPAYLGASVHQIEILTIYP